MFQSEWSSSCLLYLLWQMAHAFSNSWDIIVYLLLFSSLFSLFHYFLLLKSLDLNIDCMFTFGSLEYLGVSTNVRNKRKTLGIKQWFAHLLSPWLIYSLFWILLEEIWSSSTSTFKFIIFRCHIIMLVVGWVVWDNIC